MYSILKNIGKIISLVLISIGLFACASNAPQSEEKFVAPAQKPTLTEVRANYIQQLKNKQVQVIHLGETIRIVILDDELFVAGSANLVPEYRDVLRTVTLLINTYETTEIKVSGYLDNQLPKDVSQALSARQAQVVLNTLRYYGVDTRFVYAMGYGEENPVAWNGDATGRSLNRRVEIYFQYYPKIKGYN